MELFLSFIFEIFFYIIFGLTGGTLRWLVLRKKTLKEYIHDPWYINGFLVIGLVLIIILIVNYLP